MDKKGSATCILARSVAIFGGLMAVAAEDAEPWKTWLNNFGHDSFAYPAWISEQRDACACENFGASARCFEGAQRAKVDWRRAGELTWCAAKHFLLKHMPEFDLFFLPGSVSVEGSSMLDDNIAFSLMAWKASALAPKPPLQVALPYLLPYATYHEARVNWRPIFFAKYFGVTVDCKTSRAVIHALIGGKQTLTNWTAFKWQDFGGKSPGNAYELGPFAPGSTPPVIGPFEFTAYGYASCTGWAKFLVSTLKAVGVPAREVGSPCWNTGEFAGLATANPNVSLCWNAGPSSGPFGGKFLNNHNWVEYWDNEAGAWHFLDVATSSSAESTWFCGTFSPASGCDCSTSGGKAARDHEILAPTWMMAGEDSAYDGGVVVDVSRDLRLSTGEAVSPLVWSPRLTSALGTPLKDVGLRVVNRTSFYRCKTPDAGLTQIAL